ncbi:AAA family ATPase [Paenibacillus cucumis Kampfer et al. 2016]|uniref:Nuclease SbcCD subunit C n=1 Tax=Paenibacillus cucumis (ex Kampfer et al. 2016) TaxID=1776858 RepID=A0ABS7KF59_9BACL|nr:AAA family ATPase [Paenibacillus cucumis (ex Kampfer et al. 2016)]
MNNYYISRIYFENFKSVDMARIDFEGKNLMVLDGPNGFGKTTIFDAIELVLTGKIRRIQSNKIASTNRKYSDHLLSKNQGKPTIIKIEFISNEDKNKSIVLARVLVSNIISSTQKRPGEFGNLKLYILNDFDEDPLLGNAVDSKELIKLFGIENINDSFMMYNYVEQEESGHFFKQNEKDRMNSVSKLFNIEKEIFQKEYIEKLKNKLVRERNALERKIQEETLKYNDVNKQSIGEISYEPLIQDKEIEINWDREIIPNISRELKEEYLSELDQLLLFVENLADFKIEKKNIEIEKLSNQTEKLKAIILLGNFHDKFKDLEKKHNEQKELQKNLDILRNREILVKDLNLVIINTRMETDSYNELLSKIKRLKTMQNSTNNMSKIIEQLNNSRLNLQAIFQKLIDENPSDSISCPLCGHEKEDMAQLLTDIELKTTALTLELDETSKQVKKELNIIYDNSLNKVIQEIQFELENSKSIETDFMEQLKSYINVINDFNKAKEWFVINDIDLKRHINSEEHAIQNLDERANKLSEEIKSKRKNVSELCKDNMQLFSRLYIDRFNKKHSIIQNISIESINKKKNYIEYQYYLQMNEVHRNLKKMKDKFRDINKLCQSTTRILEVYNKNINIYRRKMIMEVEIPFYIYCGKIIQTHQRGIGVFIKEESNSNEDIGAQLKSINFVPPGKTDHDIVHSFSSGQLSSTVIAFTLALNKVYSNQKITTLLIDDPVQTMDEMNMVSLVDLLRNDFNDRQIILSTHEEKVSLYLRYKFFKYGYSVGNVNVKNELYENI